MDIDGIHPFRVGSFRVTALQDEDSVASLGDALPDVDPAVLAAALERPGAGATADGVHLSFTCLLVESAAGRWLIDAGNGVDSGGDGRLLARLADLSIDAADIDALILTHAHADHYAGMLTAAGAKVFPNARYLLGGDEWAFYSSDARLAVEAERSAERRAFIERFFLPLAPHLELLEDGPCEPLPGVRVLPAPGHTAHHRAVEVAEGGETLLAIGDAALHPLQLEHPDLASRVDHDPAIANASRRALVERALATDARVLGYHFPFPGLGRLERGPDGIRWRPDDA